MRDALYDFDVMAAATKDTAVKSITGGNCSDLGAVGSRPAYHTAEGDWYICFRVVGSADAEDSYIFGFDTDAVATFDGAALETTSFPQTAVSVPTGSIYKYKVPFKLNRFVEARVTPKSSGIFAATSVYAWLEHGPNA